MPDIYFKIECDPLGKGRPRFYRRGRFVGTYTPDSTSRFESLILRLASPHKPVTPLHGPLKVSLLFLMPIPKTKKKSVKSGDFHYIKPDIDNLIKSALDPLNGVFWKDDSQLSEVRARKVYSDVAGIEYLIREAV